MGRSIQPPKTPHPPSSHRRPSIAHMINSRTGFSRLSDEEALIVRLENIILVRPPLTSLRLAVTWLNETLLVMRPAA